MAGKYPDEVADIVAAAITTATAALTGDNTATIAVDYVPRAKLDTLTGRHVYVSPATFTDELLTRGQDFAFTAVTVTVFNRYTTQSDGPPPKDWIRDQIRWAKDYARAPVTDARDVLGSVLTAVESTPLDLYDAELLVEKSAYLATFQVTYREEVNP